MNQQLRDDVVMEKVSGINMLISLRSAWGICPFAVQIAPTFAFIWKCMKEGMKEKAILHGLQENRGFSEEKAKIVFDKFMQSAQKMGYFKSEENEA